MQGLKKCTALDWMLLISFLATGCFHEYISAIFSAAGCLYLILQISKNKQLLLKNSLFSWSVAVLVCFYGITVLWAVDRGMAWVGFIKFLPLILYLLCLWQKPDSSNLFQVLPAFGAVTVVLSAAGMLIPATAGFFSVAGRLAGFFQYPNTYALFLLICELLLLKNGVRKWNYLTLAVLLGGLLYTGSRTVFLLALGVNVVWFMLGGRKQLFAVLCAGVVLVLGAVAVLLWGQNTVLYRYLTISFTESTFVGRILYTLDALPLLLKYPFGTGYLGYSYLQTSIQTGVYSVAYAHNDILQLFLDVGWIPAGLFFSSVIVYFCRKDVTLKDKLIPATVLVHCLLDFDLQFISVFLLLLLLVDPQQGTTVVVKKNTTVFRVIPAILAAAALYMSAALALEHFQLRNASEILYPFNTRNKIILLETESDVERAEKLADDILKQNSHCYPAYSIKSRCAYAKGDFGSVIRYKNLALAENPFNHAEYEEYCQMLIQGIAKYRQQGDEKSIKVCQQEILKAKQKLDNNRLRLSKLGSMIADQPVTVLSDEILQYIDNQIKGSE